MKRIKLKTSINRINDIFAHDNFTDPFAQRTLELPGNIGLYINKKIESFYDFECTNSGYVAVKYDCKYQEHPSSYKLPFRGMLYITKFTPYTNMRHIKLYKSQGVSEKMIYRNTAEIMRMMNGNLVFYRKKLIESNDTTAIKNHPREHKLFVINSIDSASLEKDVDLLKIFLHKWMNIDVYYVYSKNKN